MNVEEDFLVLEKSSHHQSSMIPETHNLTQQQTCPPDAVVVANYRVAA